jgi:hypothetical protein
MRANHDVLNGDAINALEPPLIGVFYGGGRWPIHDIGTDSPILRIDVCGKLSVKRFADLRYIEDANGVQYEADSFYLTTPDAASAAGGGAS